MGEGSAQTVKEIEETRERLEQNITALEDRLPSPARAVRKVALGGGIGGAAFWLLVRRMRKHGKTKATARAAAPVQAVVHVIPDRWAKGAEDAWKRYSADDKMRGYATGAAAAWFLLRLAEMRHLRKLRRQTILD